MPSQQQFRIVEDSAVGSILYKGILTEFIIDAADLERVRQHRWHYTAAGYVATSVRVDISGAKPKKRELGLHTFLLSPGPDQAVLHISKNGLDNRRANLRLVPAAAASASAAASVIKKRSVELPPLCGIQIEDIPKHIWYVQANGYHRDRFAIEFKTEKLLWKSTSSKKVSLQEKLEQAKAKLAEFYAQHPHLDPKWEEERVKSLEAGFEALLKAPASPASSP
jgi:hypothetical protein